MTEIEELQLIIQQAMTKIKAIQDKCSHPIENVIGKYGANTGNYDPYDDRYWIDLHCSLCDKRWQRDDKHEDYRKFRRR